MVALLHSEISSMSLAISRILQLKRMTLEVAKRLRQLQWVASDSLKVVGMIFQLYLLGLM